MSWRERPCHGICSLCLTGVDFLFLAICFCLCVSRHFRRAIGRARGMSEQSAKDFPALRNERHRLETRYSNQSGDRFSGAPIAIGAQFRMTRSVRRVVHALPKRKAPLLGSAALTAAFGFCSMAKKSPFRCAGAMSSNSSPNRSQILSTLADRFICGPIGPAFKRGVDCHSDAGKSAGSDKRKGNNSRLRRAA